MLERLQFRLQSDQGALAALRAIPKASRSVANAIQFWDGAWTDARSLGGVEVLGPIRTAVVQTVQAAPPACQEEQVRGPRLIAIPDGSGATIVSLGSGLWTWKDLLRADARTADK